MRSSIWKFELILTYTGDKFSCFKQSATNQTAPIMKKKLVKILKITVLSNGNLLVKGMVAAISYKDAIVKAKEHVL